MVGGSCLWCRASLETPLLSSQFPAPAWACQEGPFSDAQMGSISVQGSRHPAEPLGVVMQDPCLPSPVGAKQPCSSLGG